MIQPTKLSGVVLLILCAPVLSGCTTPLAIPNTVFNRADQSTYEGLGGGFDGNASLAQKLYNDTRRAVSENSVVLQVAGENPPTRILPLPPPGQSVYISQLLEQTGVMQKMGGVSATLYRYSPAVIGGAPMVVKMSKDNDSVRPESDYALQPGDRLKVERASMGGLGELFSLSM